MRTKTFRELRKKVHAKSRLDLRKRRRRGRLTATALELRLGSFLEDLELQVRGAVISMHKKGYLTWSSGFGDDYDEKYDIQVIDGPFVLDKYTKAKLIAAGATVYIDTEYIGRTYTSIVFHPAAPDTRSIIKEWKKLLSVIPAKKRSAPLFPENYGSCIFRDRYARQKFKIKTR